MEAPRFPLISPAPASSTVERAELVDELGRGLGPDAGHAGDVVDAVAHERQHVADQLGRNAELLAHLLHPEAAVLHRVEHRHVAVAELHQILVRRADHHLHPGGRGHLGQRGDDVVGLEPGHLQLGQAERVDHLPRQRQLRGQLGRHRRAVRLVLGEDLVAEVVARGVVDDAEVRGPLLALDAQDHLAEAVDRARLQPLGRGERRQRVERAEQEVQRVDDVEARLRG